MTVYYKMRQMLSQNATAILYDKMQQKFIKYYKMRQFYYKIQQLLKNATIVLQNVSVITNCDSTTI